MATPGDHTLAAELATRAGELLLDIRDRLTVDGAPSAVMRHEGDQRSHEYLMAALAEHRPTDAVLSEEGTAHVVHPDRTGADRIWIVDPVDGTREYSEPPRSDWAVHVALVEEGRPTAGAVALPALGLTLSTVGPPHGSDLPPIGDRPRMVVSRSRPPAEALAVCEALGGELVEMGSAGHDGKRGKDGPIGMKETFRVGKKIPVGLIPRNSTDRVRNHNWCLQYLLFCATMAGIKKRLYTSSEFPKEWAFDLEF